MNEILKYIRRKLSIRVSLWVVLFATIIFTVALGFLFFQSREAVRQEAISHASQILDKTSLRVEGILNRVEVASNMTKWLVLRHPDKADSMFVYSRSMLANNPDFYNCSIAFEPYYFKDKGRYFSAYTKHDGDSIRTIQGGSDKYQYFFMDWYLMPMLLDKPCWTEPYMDYDVATNTSEMVTSFCQTIKDHHGQKIGVINTSLSISWLSQTISATKPYPNSYSIMIGRGGTYFVHPDTTKITRQTIYTQTIEKPDTALEALGHAMQRGEEGMKHMIIDGEDFYLDLLFYHRKLHRLIAIDLKLGRFKAQYKGQMELYLRWLEQNEMEPGEETPLGLLLCTEGSEEQIELLQLDKSGIKVAQYMTELPPRDVLVQQIQKSLEVAKAKWGNGRKEDEV